MPRTPMTPSHARNVVSIAMMDAQDAAALVRSILLFDDDLPRDNGARNRALKDAARILEAAGCQLRRRADLMMDPEA